MTRALRLIRTVAASPEAVFEAWTAKEHLERWSCPNPDAPLEVEVDLRVGGNYSIRMDVDGGPHTAFGTYREVDPPNRLVYTWDWKEEPLAMGIETLVTVEFAAVDGGTEIRLTHEGFPAPEAKDGHELGWTMSLERLAGQAGDW